MLVSSGTNCTCTHCSWNLAVERQIHDASGVYRWLTHSSVKLLSQVRVRLDTPICSFTWFVKTFFPLALSLQLMLNAEITVVVTCIVMYRIPLPTQPPVISVSILIMKVALGRALISIPVFSWLKFVFTRISRCLSQKELWTSPVPGS